MIITNVFCFILILFLFFPPNAGAQNKKSQASDIMLYIQLEKTEFKKAEEISVLSYLKNESTKSYYIGRNLYGLWQSVDLHKIEICILDGKNNQVSIIRGEGNWVWKKGTTIEGKINQAYLLLEPSQIFGLKDAIPIKLSRGTYKIQASYWEFEALSWQDELFKLQNTVWVMPLKSNIVNFEVLD